MKTVSVGEGKFALKFDYEKRSYRIEGLKFKQLRGLQHVPSKDLFEKYFKETINEIA